MHISPGSYVGTVPYRVYAFFEWLVLTVVGVARATFARRTPAKVFSRFSTPETGRAQRSYSEKDEDMQVALEVYKSFNDNERAYVHIMYGVRGTFAAPPTCPDILNMYPGLSRAGVQVRLQLLLSLWRSSTIINEDADSHGEEN